MTIDWTKPLVVAGTDRVATVVDAAHCVKADWVDNGASCIRWLPRETTAVTNAPPTPQIGPEHIEALGEAIEEARGATVMAREMSGLSDNPAWVVQNTELSKAAEQRAARLVEIRLYLGSL